MVHYDAFSESTTVPESSAERKIAFSNAYMGLLDYFKVMYTVLSRINIC